jgi:hypothetical protein
MPSAPTATDEKLAADLAGFRLEAEKRFGSIETALGGIRDDLVWIKRIGAFIAAFLVAGVGFSWRVIWDASALNSEVRQQGTRLEKVETRLERVERRLDGIDGKLDTLIGRTAPAPKAGG